MPGPLPWTGTGIAKRKQLVIPRLPNDDPYAEQFRAIERWANSQGLFTDITDLVTWTQGATITRASNTSVSWTQFGNVIICVGKLVATSAGTAANTMIVGGLPWTEFDNTSFLAGFGRFNDASVPLNYNGSLHSGGTGFSPTLTFAAHGGTSTAFGVNPAVTIANADVFDFTVLFRAG